ncbi:MAG: 50S ribosomal protein L17, partial [Thermomicrobiales bacterium]
EDLETPLEAAAALPPTEVALEAATPVDQETAAESTAVTLPAGAVLGDGTTACPSEFPVKGNARSKIYHTPESRVYAQTIAEFCFSTAKAAQAAGYHPPRQM